MGSSPNQPDLEATWRAGRIRNKPNLDFIFDRHEHIPTLLALKYVIRGGSDLTCRIIGMSHKRHRISNHGNSADCLTACLNWQQGEHQSTASLVFVGIHRLLVVPLIKSQYCGKYFHVMTSSWDVYKRICRIISKKCCYGLFFIVSLSFAK